MNLNDKVVIENTKSSVKLFKDLKEYLLLNYGKACKEFNLGCPKCMVWSFYDYLIDFDTEIEEDLE